ncbi:hypothetical protein ND486_27775 [Pseudonocardia sp. DR1-2]|uniref:TY-Chap2 family putative peptide chaperone n=1 Tax=unclassified Pseudonocardia TaxID=2619320 RepID=UPI00204417E2|nr:hypothetical protein [Pseudonocardia sp. DR1-2]MCM3849995.1 hypothetical protein [Pseudonocardia sp. DR1-2]
MAQSWWIASQLVRRHPRLAIIETKPDFTAQDNLALIDSVVAPSSRGAVLEIDRNGSLGRSSEPELPSMTWREVFEAGDPFEPLTRLEATAGLASPAGNPRSGRKAVAYRLIARLLSTTLNDRRPLQVRSGYLQTFQLGSGCWPELRHFPDVAAALDDVRTDDVDGQPGYRFWMLEHDHRLVAVLDTDARLYYADETSTDVYKRYRRTGSLTRTLGDTLGQFLG